ncbi:hypothetical protein E2C01_028511 [Portunus trituberculatus]|uniref:Uncharacterized protein n=1 Tax=Portunus trituberculatus TaxID=210409 RepID=A0A5B7EPA6_PORTR|nr:hypothetical protein [Portunus trituberculatus]
MPLTQVVSLREQRGCGQRGIASKQDRRLNIIRSGNNLSEETLPASCNWSGEQRTDGSRVFVSSERENLHVGVFNLVRASRSLAPRSDRPGANGRPLGTQRDEVTCGGPTGNVSSRAGSCGEADMALFAPSSCSSLANPPEPPDDLIHISTTRSDT